MSLSRELPPPEPNNNLIFSQDDWKACFLDGIFLQKFTTLVDCTAENDGFMRESGYSILELRRRWKTAIEIAATAMHAPYIPLSNHAEQALPRTIDAVWRSIGDNDWTEPGVGFLVLKHDYLDGSSTVPKSEWFEHINLRDLYYEEPLMQLTFEEFAVINAATRKMLGSEIQARLKRPFYGDSRAETTRIPARLVHLKDHHLFESYQEVLEHPELVSVQAQQYLASAAIEQPVLPKSIDALKAIHDRKKLEDPNYGLVPAIVEQLDQRVRYGIGELLGR